MNAIVIRSNFIGEKMLTADEIIDTNSHQRAVDAGVEKPAFKTEKTALQQFEEIDGGSEESALERLRLFCSFAMKGQDWLDVEKFLDDVEIKMVEPPEWHEGQPVNTLAAIADAMEWLKTIKPEDASNKQRLGDCMGVLQRILDV